MKVKKKEDASNQCVRFLPPAAHGPLSENIVQPLYRPMGSANMSKVEENIQHAYVNILEWHNFGAT